MGGFFSAPSSSSPSNSPQQNPKSTATVTVTTMSDKSQNPESNPTADPPKTLEHKDQDQESIDPSPTNENQEAEGEEEGECGFCLFMKGGECKQVFIDWENCIEEGEKKNENIVDKCFEVTSALKKCMEANSDYYGPILQAEKAAEQEAVNQLNKEKEAAAAAAADPGEEKEKPASS
ncbi:hypothetical protein L1987_57554 [Smallanthus sonchifolius]|uniref:Uncharacterized protein n=1 Tax=Smallanthus sonchifolius TaxID=185202 RepID=A0ACB9DCW3_9ASTR|nr:hypothetical protein L1987_57554 [Smallanthus sonchifolius]